MNPNLRTEDLKYPAAGCAGTAVTQVRSNEQIGQTATVVAEKGKEYGAKTFSFLRSVYANAAAQVETVAGEHGYHVDLGEPCAVTFRV